MIYNSFAVLKKLKDAGMSFKGLKASHSGIKINQTEASKDRGIKKKQL